MQEKDDAILYLFPVRISRSNDSYEGEAHSYVGKVSYNSCIQFSFTCLLQFVATSFIIQSIHFLCCYLSMSIPYLSINFTIISCLCRPCSIALINLSYKTLYTLLVTEHLFFDKILPITTLFISRERSDKL
jgi:hypothetical protein